MTVLVENGSAVATIRVRRREETPVAGFAASELRDYVAAMSDATLPIEGPCGTDTLPDCVASAVIVGPDDDIDPDFDSVVDRLAGARSDAFAIVSIRDALVCAGTTDRGTLYAVYEILEELGVRFYAPEFPFYEGYHERIPNRDSVSLSIRRFEEPSLGYRTKDVHGPSATPGTLPAVIDWMAKTRHNVLSTYLDYAGTLGLEDRDAVETALVDPLERRGLLLQAGGHNFHRFLSPEQYADDHPDWFFDEYNVFDVSQEDAVETLARNIVDELGEKPEIDIFDAWPPDAASWSSRTVEDFGSVANAYRHVVSAIRDAFERHLPDRDLTVEAIAYSSHVRPPDPEHMYADDVFVEFAPNGQDRSLAVPTNQQTGEGTDEGYDDWLRAWREQFDGTIGIYEYYRRYSWHSLPVVLPDLIRQEVPYYDEVGADGLRTYGEPADWITYELTHLLVARLAWDTGLDVTAWLNAYLDERYGSAAEAMSGYVTDVEAGSRAFLTSQKDALTGDFQDPEAVSEGLDRYRAARDKLDRAADAADSGAATHLIDRLAANAEYAVADAEISLHGAAGDADAVERSRDRVRELVDELRFDGVVLDSNWIRRRLVDEFEIEDADREDWELYRERWPASNS
jgi:hypothetical protein